MQYSTSKKRDIKIDFFSSRTERHAFTVLFSDSEIDSKQTKNKKKQLDNGKWHNYLQPANTTTTTLKPTARTRTSKNNFRQRQTPDGGSIAEARKRSRGQNSPKQNNPISSSHRQSHLHHVDTAAPATTAPAASSTLIFGDGLRNKTTKWLLKNRQRAKFSSS